MTYREAVFQVASQEVGKAKDYEYAVWANPRLPRKVLKKARLEVAAAEMRAKRLLETRAPRFLPPALKAEVMRLMKQ